MHSGSNTLWIRRHAVCSLIAPTKNLWKEWGLTRREYARARDKSVGYKSRTTTATSSVTCGTCICEVSSCTLPKRKTDVENNSPGHSITFKDYTK